MKRGFSVDAQFKTTSREAFIKACAVLAGGIDPLRHQNLVVSISGRMDVGKSLVADAILATLGDDKTPYQLAYDNKMSFEKNPAQAAKFPVRGRLITSGCETNVYFVRSAMDYNETRMQLVRHGEDRPSIIFYADSNHLQSKDVGMYIGLQNPYPYDPDKNYPKWQRDWDVLVSPEHMGYDSILTATGHLKTVGETQHTRHAVKNKIGIRP